MISHKQLVDRSSKWLKNHKGNIIVPNCPTVVSELKSLNETGEIPDVIGFCGWLSILLEIKVSTDDYKADHKKVFRTHPILGVGQHRYYVCPKGLIKEQSLPLKWGLIYESNNEFEIIRQAQDQQHNSSVERSILLSVIRRIRNGSACL